MGNLTNGNPFERLAEINSLNELLNMTESSRSSFEDDLDTLTNGIRLLDEDSPILSVFKYDMYSTLNAHVCFELYKGASDDVSATIEQLEKAAKDEG